MAKILHLDYESFSDLDLKLTGVHIYARGKNTDVWCAAFAFDDEAVQIWYPGQHLPDRVRDHIAEGKEVWAHNAAFEIEMTNHCVSKKHGFPKLDPNQVFCTMVMAYAMGLPGALENLAPAIGIREKKDMEGSRLMRQMMNPRRIEPDGTLVWWNELEKVQRIGRYCMQDVIVEREAGKRMLALSPYERRLWLLDQKINAVGITVDTQAIFNALGIVEQEKSRLNAEMRKVTDDNVATCTAVQQIKDFLEFYGVGAESLAKPIITEYLANQLHPVARKVLELRLEAGKASVAKLGPMLTGAGPDNRVRGCFQFTAAGTRRWAGRRIQLHNLKRPSIKDHTLVEEIVDGISKGMPAEHLDLLYGPPLTVMGDCIRSFLTAGEGNELLCADFSAIEARVVAWLAGQDDVLEIFKSGKDIYKVAASSIFGVPTDQVSSDKRAVGKVAILALGYQGGVGAFQTMAAGYGVKMAPAFKVLFDRADASQKDWVEKGFKQNGAKHDISREEYIASDLTKTFWRLSNPAIVEYWGAVEEASRLAVIHGGKTFTVGPLGRQVSYKKAGSFLWCRLPSGGVICYPYPEIRKKKTPWGQEKEMLTYMAEDVQSRAWQRYTTYGGSLVENLTQAVARDLLADAMLRLDEAGYPIVIHVHDEIVCELPKGEGSLEFMIETMSETPEWAKDLPVEASGWTGFRYRK